MGGQIEGSTRQDSQRKEVSKMKRMFAVLVAVVLVLGFSTAGFAHSYKGRVTSYNQAGSTLTVAGKHGERVFDILKAKMKGVIKPNESVKVSYKNHDGQMVASSVQVLHQHVSQNIGMGFRSFRYAANEGYPYQYPYTYEGRIGAGVTG
jgi:hypothetical protein